MAAFLLAALLSVRAPRLDAWFGGLTRQWKFHHVLGAAAFLLLMAHPLLLAFSAAGTSARAAADVLFPGAGARSVWAGWAALAAMAAFLAPTFSFFGSPEYQRWKSLHALSVVALILGAAHAVASGRSVPGAVWGWAGALALLAVAGRKAWSRVAGRRGYVVTRVDAVGRGVVELTLKPEGGLLRYAAGQFVYLTPLDPGLAAGRGEEHPYTVSSSPEEPVLRIAIKDLGDATRALQTAAPGGRVLVEGPYGGILSGGVTAAKELWIAGGIGLTPFLGRARSLRPERSVDIRLVYCVQDESRAHFLAELEEIAGRVAGFRVSPHYFAREGPLTSEFLRSRCPDFAERAVFVCGPAPLLAAARRELVRAGVTPARIRQEDFAWL